MVSMRRCIPCNSINRNLTVPSCCASAQSMDYRALNQFRNMILCVQPDSWPILDYADYGCYCGFGGSGTPVDDLDRSWYSHSASHSDEIVEPCQICFTICLIWPVGAAKCTTSVTLMLCRAQIAGPSWTILTQSYMITAVMRKPGQSLVAVSTLPELYVC